MKLSNFRLLIFLVSIIVFSSCRNSIKTAQLTTFSGTIKNNATSEVRLEGNDTVYKSLVDNNGFFKIQIAQEKDEVFTYTGNEFTSIHLSPGDSVYLSVDSKNWRTFDKTLTFSGDGSAKNNYFFSKSLILHDLNSHIEKVLLKKSELNFISSIDSIYSILHNHYKNFQANNPKTSYLLLDYESESIDYLKQISIIQYYIRNKNKGQHEKISKKAKSIIKKINLNNMQHINLQSYNDLIIEYFNYLEIQNSDVTDKAKALSTTLINIDKLIENSRLKSNLAQYFIRKHLLNNHLDSSFFNSIKNQVTYESYEMFKNIYNIEKPLAPGDKAPDFLLYDKNESAYTLKDFKGSYIYIDVWASYCGPCIKEFPYFEQLKQDFQGEKIAFVSISLDRKEADWLSSVSKNNITKYQFTVKNDWSSDFVKDYDLNHFGIPYYIIIDPNGNVLKLPAPKPSEAKNFLEKTLSLNESYSKLL